jgi:hypothetical protein
MKPGPKQARNPAYDRSSIRPNRSHYDENTNIEHLLPDRSAIRHTMKFINKTGRFRTASGDISTELIEDDE